jgi:hypothetical protein
MINRRIHPIVLMLALAMTIAARAAEPVKVGVIGLDTSHAPAFAKLLNAPDAGEDLAGFRVVAAYPRGSADIESSVKRIPQYTQQFRDMGIDIVDSIDALIERVDVVLLETNDGRPHLEQALAVLRAGKPVFIDKPVAGSLVDAVIIYKAAEHYRVPVYSASSLRYIENAPAVMSGKIGRVLGAETFSPCSYESHHPDLFWYGIHGVEPLVMLMGAECETVTRYKTDTVDVVVGQWPGGRIGTFRGLVKGKHVYGGRAFGETGVMDLGSYQGYRPLLVDIVKMFRSGKAPVAADQTLAVYAFMEAADESQRRGGEPVSVKQVLDQANKQAAERLAKLLGAPAKTSK